MDDHRIDTRELMELLMMSRSFDSILSSSAGEMSVQSFGDYITGLQQEKDEPVYRIIQRGHIEKSYGYKLFKGERAPSRDTCLKLAFGLELDIDDTQKLLRAAGKSALYPRVPRDAAIIYCLHNHISFQDAESVLNELEAPAIGGGEQDE